MLITADSGPFGFLFSRPACKFFLVARATIVPEIEEDLETRTFKGSKLVDVETNNLRRDREPEHAISQRPNIEQFSTTSDNRLED